MARLGGAAQVAAVAADGSLEDLLQDAGALPAVGVTRPADRVMLDDVLSEVR